MDRFADRRFGAFDHASGEAVDLHGSFRPANNLLTSSIFEAISPSVTRWIADGRGRIIAFDTMSGGHIVRFANDPVGRGWQALLNRDDRRLVRMAARETWPEPIAIRMRMADGATRWFLLRMRWDKDGAGHRRLLGTAQDIHDRHDGHMKALAAALEESRAHYRWSVDLSPQVPWTAGPDGGIEEVGPRWHEMTGLTQDETLGTGWLSAVHPDDLAGVAVQWATHVASGMPVDVDWRIRLRDGHYRWMRARASARRDDAGKVIRWYGALEDVHASKLAQDALSDSEERLRLAVESAGLGIWDFDVATGTRKWSPRFRAMLGLGEDEPATPELAMSLVHPDDRDRLTNILTALFSDCAPRNLEETLRIYRADNGALRWIRCTGWLSHRHKGRPHRIICTFLDVTETRNSEERIRWAATHDSMTSLPNRALWQATLDDMANRAIECGERFGLLLLDIDDLKQTNDTLGHDAGDALICAFAQRLAALAPPGAIVGRLGGDEFGMISASLTSSEQLEAFGATLVAAAREAHAYNGHMLECGVSMGGAVFGEHGERADDLLKAADLALYASKSAGRGRLTLFHSVLRAEAQQRSSMIRMGQYLASADLVTPYYQPKVDLRTGQVLGYEALLRWHHPRLGLQLPGTIAAAFEHGEIAIALTERMLNSVTRDIGLWLKEGFDPGRVAINASAADFANGDFADRVLQRLHDCNVPPTHFEIEVTETVFLGRGVGQVGRALRQFADAGVHVALDDFGTGFASLSHLKQYPVDILKIDRSFISNIEQDAGDAAIVDAIVKLGGSFGMEVVAEGVETALQAERLLGHGCVIAQGFYFGRPKPFADIIVR